MRQPSKLLNQLTPTSSTEVSLRLDDRPREACGVVGVSGLDSASESAFLSLYALQHRGQEAAGIFTFDEDGPHVLKGEGLVGDVFDKWSIRKLVGRTAVGHVRYSTAGGNDFDNVQPIIARYSHGNIALAHNGNLTNHFDLPSYRSYMKCFSPPSDLANSSSWYAVIHCELNYVLGPIWST